MSLIEKFVGEDFTLVPDGKRFSRTIEHSSLVIDNAKNLFYWNSRGLCGDCLFYLQNVRGLSKKDALYLLSVSSDFEPVTKSAIEIETSQPDLTLVDVFYDYGKRNREYWYNKRGYTDVTIDNFKLGFTGEWYTIPIYENGKFVNFQIRKEIPKRIKHWYRGVGPHPFNFSILNLTDWVIIAEGPPDAIILRQNGLPGISQTGGSHYWNKEWMPYFTHIKRIYVVYDNDSSGIIGAKNVANLFGKKALVYTFSGWDDKFDITDYFKQEFTRENFMNILERESKYEYEI